ncbi:MAG: transposase [Clostridia bacterium]|nr:transposase [Clostridia bacterium]
MFKYDLHVHTAQTSPCASMTGAQQVQAYKELGYTGIVVTDHYYNGFFEKNASPTWAESMDKYFAGYFDAKAEGDKIGIDVFQSAEVTIASSRKDYLIYGVEPEFFYVNEKLFDLSEAELISLVHSAGGLVFAAHPYRREATECYPYGNIDGVEVINGNPLSNNNLALKYAKDRNLLMCSGSDAHNKGDAGLGGITTNIKIKNIAHLAEILKNGEIGFANTSTLKDI